MALPNQRNSNDDGLFPDIRQAEQSLLALQQNLQLLKTQLSESPPTQLLGGLSEETQKAIAPLLQLKETWAQVTAQATSAAPPLDNDGLQNNVTQLRVLQAEVKKVRQLTNASNANDGLGDTLQGLSQLHLGQGTFAPIFQDLISGVQKTRTAFRQFKSDAENTGKGVLDFFQNDAAFKSALGDFGSQTLETIGQQFLKNKKGLTKALGNTLTSAVSGAVGGLAGGPLGIAIGAITGAVGGASGSSGGRFDVGSGLLGLPFGLVGFAIGGFLGGAKKAAEEAAKRQKQLQQTQAAMQAILAQADQNDLTSLQQALKQANSFTSGGGAAFQEKYNTVQQIKQAIQNRKQVIADAIKDLSFQNMALAQELKKFDDQPLENLNIDREINLSQLANDRDKALAQFKDSLDTQAQITQNYELKRQALLRDSSLEIIDTVIDEQNRIRELRAQAAVDTAKANGNALDLINAELQARLVAIDNEVASFKGAEEEKTELLKAKAAERNAIIVQANQQVNDLLQQGLNILNQGLVVGETKTQTQQKQLTQLFGKLNPLGLIQSDGNLVQSSVTVGSGAFQFILNGINDAQSLIDQLQDPLIQNELQQALNAAISRS